MTPEQPATMGDRLRLIREAKHLSLSELGAAAGITKAYLVRIETGKQKNPGLLLLERLATALDVAPGWLAWGELRQWP
jgi:XRE family transcriptional regulator of biofilm formation